jgi:catechol 2,3-dioxygenase-like lactoylglutathione lyase family enzyme
VWDDGALHVCTGSGEQKWRNLAGDPRCAVVTGRNDRDVGTDYVVEGIAERIVDDDRLGVLAAAWEDKYGAEWHFDVVDGAFASDGQTAHVFRIRPQVAYAFGKAPFSHTRYRWPTEAGPDGTSLRDATVAVRLPAQDLDRARRFYADVLRLEPHETREGGLRYVCGHTEFVVFASSGRPSGTHTQMGFYVADIDRTVADLTGRGVVFEQVEMGDLPVDGVIVDIPGMREPTPCAWHVRWRSARGRPPRWTHARVASALVRTPPLPAVQLADTP